MQTFNKFTSRLLFITALLICGVGVGQTSADAWINEIHYDNTGGDNNEGVEIVIADISTYPLNEWKVVLYNGNNGETYGTINYASPDNQSTENGFTIAWKSSIWYSKWKSRWFSFNS